MKKKKEKLAFGRLNLLRGDTLNGNKRIKIGFIGGGPNSFIGYTHRLASRFDNKFETVAGVAEVSRTLGGLNEKIVRKSKAVLIINLHY